MSVTLETQLENYTLEKEIGRGDMTIVYQAHRKSDGASVAVKVVPPQFTFDELFVRRFQDAAGQATKLEHPNIVRTFEAGKEDDVLYIVRELIQAKPLSQVIDEDGPLAPERMRMIAQQIASALDYAHQRSIMHGDLSASRVYVGLNDYTIVADFGQTQAMAGTSLVKQGFAIGSPETIAPERVHGQGPSRQSDLYSLGVLCYQMLAGVPPFQGTPTTVLHAQAYEQPRPLHLVIPTVPVALSETINRMLSKGLELRYNTGAEFARALDMSTQGNAPMWNPATAAAQRKAAGLETSSRWSRPLVSILAAIIGLACLLGLGFGAMSYWNNNSSDLAAFFPTNPTAPLTATPVPTEIVAATNTPNRPPATNTTAPTSTSTSPPTITPTETPVPTVTPTSTPTLAPFPTPGLPTVEEDSPFTNLVLAHAISEANVPERVGTTFAPGGQPVYLFFDYDQIEPGTSWTHRWTWGDTDLETIEGTWPENYNLQGTAWVFYSPSGGYQPGPYQVTLEINGRTVATATFVIEPGGL